MSQDAQSHLAAARTLYQQGQHDAAITELQHAIRLAPQNVEARFGLGNCYAARGHYPAAIAEYHQVLRLRPDSAAAFLALGNILARNNQPVEAQQALRQVLVLDRGDLAQQAQRLLNAVQGTAPHPAEPAAPGAPAAGRASAAAVPGQAARNPAPAPAQAESQPAPAGSDNKGSRLGRGLLLLLMYWAITIGFGAVVVPIVLVGQRLLGYELHLNNAIAIGVVFAAYWWVYGGMLAATAITGEARSGYPLGGIGAGAVLGLVAYWLVKALAPPPPELWWITGLGAVFGAIIAVRAMSRSNLWGR
jgi:tetratricopeptide (TPR) repeat protein